MPKWTMAAAAAACAWMMASSSSHAELAPGAVHRVSDFDSPYTTQRAAPMSLLALDSKVLYLAHDSSAFEVRELWVSDGTTAGTYPLRDLCGGASTCDLETWLSMGSFALIRIAEGVLERERLWRTDGTVAGTYPLTGATTATDYDSDLVAAGPYVYFDVCDGDSCAIWSTDGTLAGTKRVDATGDADRPGYAAGSLVAWHDDVYFLGWDDRGDGLWRASRLSGHVDKVRALPESYVAPSALVLAGDRLFFFAENGGRELWTSDGTAAGTVPLTRFRPAKAIAEYAELTALGGRVWFTADDGEHGWQLWASNGTPAGTRRATNFANRHAFGDVDADAGPSLPGSQLAWLNGKLLFAAVASGDDPRLWTTDGNRRSTALLRGCPGGCPCVVDEDQVPMVTIGNRAAFFGYRPPSYASRLWVTDGTGAGTVELPVDLEALTVSSGGVEIAAAGGRWFVGGDALWVTDGTRAGTMRLASTEDSFWSAHPAGVAAVAGSVYFRAVNAKNLWGLWQTTGAGAREVFTPPAEPSNYAGAPRGHAGNRLVLGGDGAFWSANARSMARLPGTATGSVGVCGAESTDLTAVGSLAFVVEPWDCTLTDGTNFWSTDGTPEGTTAIRLRDADVRSNVVSWDDDTRALFVSTGGLWTSDGTASGTTELVPLPSLPPSEKIVASDGVVYFVLRDEATKIERLWSSDGTAAGTGPLGPSWATVESGPVVLDGRVHVLARETAGGPPELWTVDPDDGSSRSLALSELGARDPVALTAAAGRLWFAAYASDDGSPLWLWASNGTAAGTKRLPATIPGQYWNVYSLPITALGNNVYFAQSDAEHDRELWRSNGTVAGTAIVADLAPGLADGGPASNLVVWRGRLWFAADDGVHGVELWSTDGSAAGTRFEADVDTGPASSWPGNLTVAGDHLFFLADDGIHGEQLWAAD
ncbi:MAG TPA: hypothetical protein VGS57_12805 [Thermoanaerobaculia bacterium]|jgi:ELWxxDGT repeat protein|nr:hypothetical protein [Thermoanaerobaculia bacterium]